MYLLGALGEFMCSKDVTILSICDIPVDVIFEIWEKWVNIDKWYTGIWTACSLCGYMAYYEPDFENAECWDCENDDCNQDVCEVCPISHNKWCGGFFMKSRLTLLYHHGNVADWKRDKDEFVKMLENELFVRS